jgi:hypothetical protein
MLFRLRFQELGAHTHVRVFAGKGTFTLAKCGDLVFRNEEWAEFQKNLYRFMEAGSDIEVVPEGGSSE